jgi:hypothetical protein
MPTFNADIEFEVFCGTCGAGLCGQSDTRSSRSRGQLQVTVEACKDCIDRGKEEAVQEAEVKFSAVRDELEKRISELEAELEIATA